MSDIHKDAVKLCKIPVWVTVSGAVSLVDKQSLSFVITTAQHVISSNVTDNLHVRGQIEQSAKWRESEKRLPMVDVIVHFEGMLDDVNLEDGLLRPVILLDFIIYQSRPEKKEENKNTEEDDRNIIQCTQIFSQTDSEASEPSQKVLGKRKASYSEEEVAQAVEDEEEKESEED
jgi:hypothetical protein